MTIQERLDDTFVSTINKIYIVSKQDFSTQQAKSIIEQILNKLTEQELNYFKERFKSIDPQNKIIPEITKIITIKEINKINQNTNPSINNNKHGLNEFYKNTSIIGTGKNKREYTFETLNKYGIFPE